MYHSIKLIAVDGFQIFRCKTILEHESVKLLEEGRNQIKFSISYGLSSNVEKSLNENQQIFDEAESIYLLFSDDDITYQALLIYGVKYAKIDSHSYVFEAYIVEAQTPHVLQKIDYLVRKEEKKKEREALERLMQQVKDDLCRE
ncbi:hypothetical protein ACFVS2_25935 [Brevibacillus sp. NPDC058079]|uniref:hypothetical protein n=1 Tax=Brevibacillus sp. NPDC058079 TaxID=3346330 RepID=UPI0036E4E021